MNIRRAAPVFTTRFPSRKRIPPSHHIAAQLATKPAGRVIAHAQAERASAPTGTFSTSQHAGGAAPARDQFRQPARGRARLRIPSCSRAGGLRAGRTANVQKVHRNDRPRERAQKHDHYHADLCLSLAKA